MRLIHFLNEDIFMNDNEMREAQDKIHEECMPWLTASKGYILERPEGILL